MGEFDNEVNLLLDADIKNNFVRAKLLNEDPLTHEEGIRKLLARYTKEQLVYLPGGTQSFDRHVVSTS